MNTILNKHCLYTCSVYDDTEFSEALFYFFLHCMHFSFRLQNTKVSKYNAPFLKITSSIQLDMSTCCFSDAKEHIGGRLNELEQ